MFPHLTARGRAHRTLAVLATGVAATSMVVSFDQSAHGSSASPAAAQASACHLGNGVSHVINLVFDNVHFGRDNPNVPSDLEQMPHLLNFLKSNGTVLSNVHTPMIAHTADDSLSIYTGLYGDRHGQPLSNSYRTYNPDGSSDPAGSFAYWTTPVYDTASTPTPGHDTAPTMVYSPTVPAGTDTSRSAPAPWVPFTRAGCDVGDFSTANMVLENTALDLPTIFGPNSPEMAQYRADSDPFKDPETADYVGVAVHCATASPVCSSASGVKYGQNAPSATAVTDRLPSEPGGYHGYEALFGHRYVAPQLGAGTPNLTSHGYPVTDANGNLTDLDGTTITNQYSHTAGFPGFNPTATQSLAYIADMQESGIPVTYGYISDIHERKPGTSGCTTATATSTGKPLGPGDSCYAANAAAYDQAFAKFFDRLARDGITAANTLFVISAEENDQFDGANVGRATAPTPAGCTGTPGNYCSYAAGQIGELQANVNGLLSGTASASTPFALEPQGASIYANGQPGPTSPTLRQLERDTAAMTADNPYSGAIGQHIVKYQADAAEERILHMQTADRLRLPSYTMFPVPDYYFATSGPNLSINSSFAWNHGYYSPNIDITWAGLVGPGVKTLGIDGPPPTRSNESQDPNSTRTVPRASTTGDWVEEVDLRPTMMHLTGLHDDYTTDGTVVTPLLAQPATTLSSVRGLQAAYHAINSSVGPFATDTLIADSQALRSGSGSNDRTYAGVLAALTHLADHRDRVATRMKDVLAAAAAGRPVSRGSVVSLEAQASALLRQAEHLVS